MLPRRSSRRLKVLEAVLWIGAGGWLAVGVAGLLDQRTQAQRVEQWLPATVTTDLSAPDQSDWSQARRTAWQHARAAGAEPPMAVLRIPDLEIQAEIFPGTSERVLDLGVGHIQGTATPGSGGNVGLAAHRDGYFRRLKDVRIGEEIRIRTGDAEYQYRVASIDIVLPDATHVLAPTPEESLTLVTCYPFYFLGNAPQRFIVRATRVTDSVQPNRKDVT